MGKKITILSILVLVLVLIVWIKNLNLGSKNDSLLFSDIKSQQVKVLTMEQFTNGIRLEKNEDWTVAPFETDLAKKILSQKEEGVSHDNLRDKTPSTPADPAVVIRAIDTLLALPIKSPVSTNPDKHALFEITDEALLVTLLDSQNKKLGAVYVGKQGTTPFSTYVRRQGENDVFLVSQDLSSLFKQTLDEWKPKPPPQAEEK